VQEYIDNSLEYSEPVTSFDETFSEDVGSHFFVTKAWDKSGGSFVADRTVTVYSGTPGPTCSAASDSVSICLPSGDTTSSPVQIHKPRRSRRMFRGTAISYVQTTQDLSSGTHNLVFKIWDIAGSPRRNGICIRR